MFSPISNKDKIFVNDPYDLTMTLKVGQQREDHNASPFGDLDY